EARDEIINRAQKGDTVPVAEAKRIIEDAKDKQQQPKRKRTKPQVAPAKEKPKARDDIGPESAGEAERLRVRVEELQAAKRRLEIKVQELERKTQLQETTIAELRSEIAELQKTSGDPMSVSVFQATIRKWEDTVETQKNIIRNLQKENANLRAGVG